MSKLGRSFSLVVGLSLSTGAAAQQPPAIDGWAFEDRRDAMSDFVAGFGSLASVEGNGRIILTCQKYGKNSVHLLFYPNVALSPGPRVAEFRFDDRPSFRDLVIYNSDNVVWINLKKFLEKGRGAALLRARLSDSYARPFDLTFNVTQMQAAARSVAVVCKDPIQNFK